MTPNSPTLLEDLEVAAHLIEIAGDAVAASGRPGRDRTRILAARLRSAAARLREEMGARSDNAFALAILLRINGGPLPGEGMR